MNQLTALEELILATNAEQDLLEELAQTPFIPLTERKEIIALARQRTRNAQDRYNRERATRNARRIDRGGSTAHYTGRWGG